jgi:hypothetical protein
MAKVPFKHLHISDIVRKTLAGTGYVIHPDKRNNSLNLKIFSI